MKTNKIWLEQITKLGLILMMGVSMSACSSTSWKEEVLLHDGSKIIAKRSQSYGGRHEIGQGAPIKEQEITFTVPNTKKSITFKSEYGEDIGRADFKLVALHILNGTSYIVAVPNLCLSYNKWGRPNPPYVLFRYDDTAWQRITLTELPAEFKTLNLVINSKGDAEAIANTMAKYGVVPAESIMRINSELTQPEYKTILREPIMNKNGVSNTDCEELIKYKSYWIMPNDSTAHSMVDRMIYEKSK